MKVDILVKAFALSFYRFFRFTQFPPSACAPKDDLSKQKQVCHRRMCHLSLFLNKQVCHCRAWKVFLFAKFFGQSACLTTLGVPPCFLLLQETVAPSLVLHLPFFCFVTSSNATKAGVPADGGNFVLLSLCLSGF